MIERFLNDDGIQLGFDLGGIFYFDRIPVPDQIFRAPTIREYVNAPMSVSLRVVSRSDRQKYRLSDVGVGVSQLVPVIAAGVLAKISIIEQPELHLHPKLQLELSSFFIEMVGKGRLFILETHSENMILRVLRAIRETAAADIMHRRLNITPDQVSVLYFEPVGTHTEVRRLRISEDGEFLERWPGGFFAEREAELF